MTADSGVLPALHSAHVSGTFWARSCGSAWPTASPPQITFKVIVLLNISLTSASKTGATVTPEIIIFYHSLFWDVFTPSSLWLQPFLWRIVLHKSAGGILNQPHHRECVFVCGMCDWLLRRVNAQNQANSAAQWTLLKMLRYRSDKTWVFCQHLVSNPFIYIFLAKIYFEYMLNIFLNVSCISFHASCIVKIV